METVKIWLKKFKRNEKGLTLVELLAVIVILAIIGTIATVSVSNIIENSKKDAHVANAIQIINAAKLYEASVGKADAKIEATTLINEGYLEPLIDPWKKDNTYGNSAFVEKREVNGTTDYIIQSFNAEGCKLTATGAFELDLINEGREICR